jgi:hypothetical protein
MYDYRRSQPFEAVRVPRTNTPEIAPGSFVLLPVGWLPETSVEQRLVQQWVYQWAWAQAQAVLRPSLPERDLLAVWN